MGDWHGACTDVTRTGGVTLSVVMSTKETPARVGTDKKNGMEGCKRVPFIMQNKRRLSGALWHSCDSSRFSRHGVTALCGAGCIKRDLRLEELGSICQKTGIELQIFGLG